MFIDIDGTGEVEILATAYTLVIYEQEFHSDPIKDVFGKHQLDGDKAGEKGVGKDAAAADGSAATLYLDFTQENWIEETRLLWAMVKTANVLADDRGDVAPNDRVPGYREWMKRVGKVNMRDIADAVFDEAVDGFFHTGAAVSA